MTGKSGRQAPHVPCCVITTVHILSTFPQLPISSCAELALAEALTVGLKCRATASRSADQIRRAGYRGRWSPQRLTVCVAFLKLCLYALFRLHVQTAATTTQEARLLSGINRRQRHRRFRPPIAYWSWACAFHSCSAPAATACFCFNHLEGLGEGLACSASVSLSDDRELDLLSTVILATMQVQQLVLTCHVGCFGS